MQALWHHQSLILNAADIVFQSEKSRVFRRLYNVPFTMSAASYINGPLLLGWETEACSAIWWIRLIRRAKSQHGHCCCHYSCISWYLITVITIVVVYPMALVCSVRTLNLTDVNGKIDQHLTPADRNDDLGAACEDEGGEALKWVLQSICMQMPVFRAVRSWPSNIRTDILVTRLGRLVLPLSMCCKIARTADNFEVCRNRGWMNYSQVPMNWEGYRLPEQYATC